jgi:uncharacterized protein YgbK (DUF1537 family)
MMKVLIIADDLTGALDTTSKFGKGSVVSLRGEVSSDFVGISTDTRLLRPDEARLRVRDSLKRFSGWHYLYKKIDSTMRGNVGAEFDEICESSGVRIPFTPAYPEQGRIVREGLLYVRGRLLEETDYVRELPKCSSDILEIVKATSRLRVGYWYGEQDIMTFRDVRDRSELSRAFRLIEESGFKVMGGSAGLAMELSNFLGCEKADYVELYNPLLFISGSTNEVTLKQLERLSERIEVLSDGSLDLARKNLMEGSSVAISFDLGSSLSRIGKIAELLLDLRPGSLVIIGGETLRRLLDLLGASAIRIGSYPEEGLAAGWIVGGPMDGTPLISKAGGFGDPETLLRILSRVRR